MNRKANIAYCAIFLAFIGVFFLLSLALPKRDFSPQENRMLQTAPDFSLKNLFSGEFSSQSEDFVTDQFPFRDNWTTLKARCELAVGKDSNNGVFLCENETLIKAYSTPVKEEIDFNIESINTLCANVDIPVYFALIPTASEIWSERLPGNAPNDSQKDLINYVYSDLDCECIDVYSSLTEHKNEEIFYRTDHHWTCLGAYYGYAAVADGMGLEARSIDSFQPDVVTDSFYGTTYSSSGFSWVKPDSITTFVPQGDAVINSYFQGVAVQVPLYDEKALDGKDKYSYFYGGNTPLLQIDTGVSEAGKLLIIRDSYMDSMSPFLFSDFSQIHVIDLRYYKLSIKKYIEENRIDSVLVCYSVPNFSEDKNIFLTAY